MPQIMSLEGPRISEIDRIRGQLYAATPRPIWQLSGLFDPIKVYPLWAIGGVLLGAWLAGTTRGQQLVRKIRRK